MTLAVSGEMSAGGNVVTRSINLELGRAYNFPDSALGSPAFRGLAGVPSGAIRLGADFYGKSAISLSLAGVTSVSYNLDFGGEVRYRFFNNGTITFSYGAGFTSVSNWASPTTSLIGNSYWIRFTQTYYFGDGGTSSTGSTGWISLGGSSEGGGSATSLFAATSGSGNVVAEFTIEIATDPFGSNVVISKSNVFLEIAVAGG